MEQVEKKPPVRNLERIGEKKFQTYEEAKVAQTGGFYGLQAPDKVKIFARYDGTFDVVAYKKIEKEPEQKEVVPQSKSMERRIEAEKRHGLKAKERRAADKKQS